MCARVTDVIFFTDIEVDQTLLEPRNERDSRLVLLGVYQLRSYLDSSSLTEKRIDMLLR